MEKNINFFITNSTNKKISSDYINLEDALEALEKYNEEVYLHAKIIGQTNTIILAWWKPEMEKIKIKIEENFYDYL